jgi:hypothetical protein
MFALLLSDESPFITKAPQCWQLRFCKYSMIGKEPCGSMQPHLSLLLKTISGLDSAKLNYSIKFYFKL